MHELTHYLMKASRVLMMKTIVKLLVLVVLAVISLSANPLTVQDASAEVGGSTDEGRVSSILYNCNVSFSASGRSIYIGIGYSEIDGKGTISCYDLLTGATQHIPIKVKARGPGAGLGITGLNLSGGATGIGLTSGPEELLGRYGVVRGNVAVGVGAAAGVGLRLSKGAVTLNVNIDAQSGLGAGVDLMFVELSLDGEKVVQPPSPPSMATAAATTASSTMAPQGVVQVQTQPIEAQVLYVQENQPVQLVDAKGRVLKVLVLRARR